MIWNEIMCLGDSLTFGARDRYGRSYPVELGKILTEEIGEFYICHNYGVNGETSSDLLRRSWSILKSNKNSAKICLLWIGTNDTKIPNPVHIYEDNLRQLILSIKANGMLPIIGTLPALKFSPYYCKNHEYIEIYNTVIKKMSDKFNIEVCCMNDLEEYLIDGVHFTHEGYKAVAERWKNTIMSLSKNKSENILV
jgi:lysophospholipase L1-like esterase